MLPLAKRWQLQPRSPSPVLHLRLIRNRTLLPLALPHRCAPLLPPEPPSLIPVPADPRSSVLSRPPLWASLRASFHFRLVNQLPEALQSRSAFQLQASQVRPRQPLQRPLAPTPPA